MSDTCSNFERIARQFKLFAVLELHKHWNSLHVEVRQVFKQDPNNIIRLSLRMNRLQHGHECTAYVKELAVLAWLELTDPNSLRC